MNLHQWELQNLTSSGWRTIATGDRKEVQAKFQDFLLKPGERRMLDEKGIQVAYVKLQGDWR